MSCSSASGRRHRLSGSPWQYMQCGVYINAVDCFQESGRIVTYESIEKLALSHVGRSLYQTPCSRVRGHWEGWGCKQRGIFAVFEGSSESHGYLEHRFLWSARHSVCRRALCSAVQIRWRVPHRTSSSHFCRSSTNTSPHLLKRPHLPFHP